MKLRVLIIDDDASLRQMLKMRMEKRGFKITLAADGIEGIRAIEEGNVDMVLCDIRMPRMDGISFLKKANELKPHIPIIIMSGEENTGLLKSTMQHSALNFLKKPFHINDVYAIIAKYAEQRISSRVVSLKGTTTILLVNERLPKISRALASSGTNLYSMNSEEDALKFFDEKVCELVVYAMDPPESMSSFFQKIKAKSPDTKIVCVVDNYRIKEFTDLFKVDEIDNMIIRNENFSGSEFLVEIRKLFSKDIFGMEKYLRWGNELNQHVVHHTSERYALIDKVGDYLKLIKTSPSNISRIQNIIDEFLTNALYNAPVDEVGHHLYQEKDRTCARQCTEREKALLTYSFDGDYLGLSIQDNFGSISKEKVFEVIRRCFIEGCPANKEGGAGLGLYMCFMTLNKLVINIHPTKKTEFIGLIDLRQHMNKINPLDKSLSIFVIPNANV